MAELDWAWLAGLIDGEGCLSYAKRQPKIPTQSPQFTAHLQIQMCDQPTIERAARLLGAKVSSRHRLSKGWRRSWNIGVTGERVRIALVKLLPYLTTKHHQAILLLEAIAACPSATSKGVRLTEEERVLREGYYLVLRQAKRVA